MPSMFNKDYTIKRYRINFGYRLGFPTLKKRSSTEEALSKFITES